MLIDENYINQYKKLHDEDETYGTSSVMFKDEISLIIEYLKPKTVLDYGCGKGKLSLVLGERFSDTSPKTNTVPSSVNGIHFYNYDPSIEKYNHIDLKHYDLIINTDVLEHIPEKDLDDVITKIASLSQKVYFGLNHKKAAAILPNGENAHCTVKPQSWYKKLMSKHFDHLTLLPGRSPHLSVILTFEIPKELVNDYYKTIGLDKNYRYKRMLYKLIWKLSFGSVRKKYKAKYKNFVTK